MYGAGAARRVDPGFQRGWGLGTRLDYTGLRDYWNARSAFSFVDARAASQWPAMDELTISSIDITSYQV